MNFLRTGLLIIGFLALMSTCSFGQEDDTTSAQAPEKPATLDDVRGRVDGIDENVNALLSDVAGLKKIKISGYIQAQFEKTESGAGFIKDPYDAKEGIQSRFRIRRSRLKFAYNAGMTQMVVQGDFSNTGFTLKDAYLQITDPWTNYFMLTTGVFNRPNYEVEYSSGQRESMERSAVVRALYPDERDLGAMLTIEPEDWFKLQLAGFNNTYQGYLKQPTGPNFNDEPFYFMARLTRSLSFQDLGLGVDFGVHARLGSVIGKSPYVIEGEVPVSAAPDSAFLANHRTGTSGAKYSRNWFGAEAQIYWDFLGGMKIMGEYIAGSDINDFADFPATAAVVRKRSFNGYYAMLVKNIGEQWQFAAKYDSYTPNTGIAKGQALMAKDLQTNTFGLGIHNYSLPNIRVSLWYDMPVTEATKDEYTRIFKTDKDPVDNVLTLRLQYKF